MDCKIKHHKCQVTIHLIAPPWFGTFCRCTVVEIIKTNTTSVLQSFVFHSINGEYGTKNWTLMPFTISGITILVQTIAVGTKLRQKVQDADFCSIFFMCWTTLWNSFYSIVLLFAHLSCKRVILFIHIVKFFKILILKEPQKWFYDVTAESQKV